MGWAEDPGEYWQRVSRHADDACASMPTMFARASCSAACTWRTTATRTRSGRSIAPSSINPNDADALAGRGHVLVWLGRAEEAIETLEFAQRIDPELNAFDRFALCLAYYLQAALRLRPSNRACSTCARRRMPRFNLVVLAAAYAQANRPADTRAHGGGAAVAATPPSTRLTFGNKFRDPKHLAKLRAGLRKAGIYSADR